MIHLSIFLLNLAGFALILPTTKRQKKLFVSSCACLENQKVTNAMRWIGFLLLFLSLCVGAMSVQPWFFVVSWFGWLTAAAGVVFLGLFLFEHVKN